MSSESDGGGGTRGWTLVDRDGRAEDVEDSSSGSSSDFVDLEDDQVRYHAKRSSVTGEAGGDDSPPSSPASVSGLPANFRAQSRGSNTSSRASPAKNVTLPSHDDEDDEDAGGDRRAASGELCSHGDASAPRGTEGGPSTSDNGSLDRSSSSGSTLTGSQSLLPPAAGEESQVAREEDIASESLTCSQSFLPPAAGEDTQEAREEDIPPDRLTCSQSLAAEEEEEEEPFGTSEDHSSLDAISIDSIEVLSLPPDREASPGGEAEGMSGFGEAVGGVTGGAYDGRRLEALPAFVSTPAILTVDVTPENGGDGGLSCPSDESDVSEFERIEPEVIPAVEAEAVPDLPDSNDEASKMDVAGARLPDEEAARDKDPAANVPPGLFDHTRNVAEGWSVDRDDLLTGQLRHPSSNLPPANDRSLPGPPSSLDFSLWRDQSPASIRPFPLDRLPVGGSGGARSRTAAVEAAAAAAPSLFLSRRFGPFRRQPSHGSSDEGFELLPRRQDDDAVSSSESDVSGFVNVRQRRGSSFSRSLSSQPSDAELDALDSVSNFTDLSEDCLPANMMPQSQKAGVRQYRHKRDDGLNTRLDWLVAMVLLAGLALGIGHFIGSSQELAHQNSISTGQVQRLRELQDDLVICLDRRAGIDHRRGPATERSSPALQALRLLEGLNVKMMEEESLDDSRLLEQQEQEEEEKVGPEEVEGLSDGILGPEEEEEGEKQPIGIQRSLAGEGNNGQTSTVTAVELESPGIQEPSDAGRRSGLSADLSWSKDGSALEVGDGGPELQTDDVIRSGDEGMMSKDAGRSEVTDAEAKEDLVVDASETTLEPAIQGNQGPGEASEEKPPEGEGAEVDTPSEDQGEGLSIDSDPAEGNREGLEPEDSESPMSGDDESTVRVLQRKMELMEEKMDEMIEASRQWQEMLKESKRTDDLPEEETASNSEEGGDDDETDEREKDSLAGIAATFQSLWPDLLSTDRGKEFLQYIDETQDSFRHEDTGSQGGEPPSWSDALYKKMDALKALSQTEEVQSVLNNTKLFARHLGNEVESVSEFLRNQSARLSVEGANATVEALGKQAGRAWTTLRNATGDVVDFNRKVLSTVGEGLAETYHSVENASAQILAKQNLSLSGVGDLAQRAWGTVKNYSAMVQDHIVNSTSSGSTADEPSGFDEEPSSGSPKSEAGFGESLKGAWDTVRNYSANFTSKQNLSISGLRERVKAAWGRVKDTSSQVLEDISEADLGGKLRTGARKLGEKVDTVVHTVKAKVRGLRGKKDKKQHRGKKKHPSRSKRREQKQRKAEGKLHKKKQKQKQKREEKEQGTRDHGTKSDKQHHGRSKAQAHSKQTKGRLYSAPPRPEWVLPAQDKADTKENEGRHSDAPQQEDSQKPEWRNAVPPRQQHAARPEDTNAVRDEDRLTGDRQDQTFGPKEQLRMPRRRCPPLAAGAEGKEDSPDAKWEELLDCIDMHCRGDQGCMRGQRRDAAMLYAELLDYQQWLREQRLAGDARELDEFLEELGEFLSETDSDDGDLDELKEEFGEMVQDMEDGARKRERRLSEGRDNRKTDVDVDSAAPQPDLVEDPSDKENKTIVIDLKSLPKKPDPESLPTAGERRKHAGRGFHSVGGEDWYLRRARDRAEQRGSTDDSVDPGQQPGGGDWYLHWAQGRIDSRTGVTVWDMYEWIKERYLFREELRSHEIKDHTNWFLRRP